MIALLLAILPFAPAPGCALSQAPASAGAGEAPDCVVLRNGEALRGRVIVGRGPRVVLRQGKKERSIPRADVAGLESLERSLEELLASLDAELAASPAALLAQAAEVRARGLAGEADLLCWWALVQDGSLESAHEALGHRRVGAGWQVRSGRAWRSFELVRDRKGEWGEAWELPTTHYLLRTDLPLAEALRLAIDLERYYACFQALLGDEVEMRLPDDPLRAEVHADIASFPQVGGRAAWFDSADNVLQVDASAFLDRRAVFHEATHQMLHVLVERGSQAKGEVPAWLSEGLSEYLASSAGGAAGFATFAPGRPDPGSFEEHARASDPYDLARMLTFDSSDFGASSKARLKYAQAYTLVHCMLHAEDGRWRTAFFAFLRGVWQGRSSTTDFGAALGAPEKEFEQAWRDWVGVRAR